MFSVRTIGVVCVQRKKGLGCADRAGNGRLIALFPMPLNHGEQNLGIPVSFQHQEFAGTDRCCRDSLGLAHLKRLNDLESLYLGSTQITDVGVAQLIHLSKLKRLGLGQTRITDEGLEHLRRLKNLKSLSLRQTAVSEEAISRFSAALPDCEILR
jgi:hypothetical protein